MKRSFQAWFFRARAWNIELSADIFAHQPFDVLGTQLEQRSGLNQESAFFVSTIPCHFSRGRYNKGLIW